MTNPHKQTETNSPHRSPIDPFCELEFGERLRILSSGFHTRAASYQTLSWESFVWIWCWDVATFVWKFLSGVQIVAFNGQLCILTIVKVHRLRRPETGTVRGDKTRSPLVRRTICQERVRVNSVYANEID
jgi:hypothetical protein